MTDDSLDFIFFHVFEESSRHRDERAIFRSTCGECIWFSGIVVTNLRHFYITRLSNTFDRFVDETEFFVIRMSVLEEDDIVSSFRRPLRKKEGDK